MRIAGCVGGGEQDCLGAVHVTWALCVQLLNDRLFEIQSFLQWLLHNYDVITCDIRAWEQGSNKIFVYQMKL